MSNYSFTTLSTPGDDRATALAAMYIAVKTALNLAASGAGDALPSIADAVAHNTLKASSLSPSLSGTIDIHVHTNPIYEVLPDDSLATPRTLGHSADLLLDTSKCPELEAETVLAMIAPYWSGTARTLTEKEWLAGADKAPYDKTRPVLVRDGVYLWLAIDEPRHVFGGFHPLSQADLDALGDEGDGA